MAYSVESRSNNPANQLRDALDQAERLIVGVNSENVEELLLLLDKIEYMFDVELAEFDADLRPEEGRWEGLLSRLTSQPEPIVKAANAQGGLKRLRAKHNSTDNFWWRLDEYLAERRRKTLRRTAITIAVVIALIFGAYWTVETFFPPNPETVMMVEATGRIDRLVAEQRWEEAMAIVEEARTSLPNEPELAIWEAVLAERLGDADRAARALADAESLLADRPAAFQVALGNTRLRVGDLEGAQQAGQSALEYDPNQAQAYFLLGGVAEMNGDIPVAIDMFERTYDLAIDDSPQLAVIAKVRLGQLLQSPVQAAAEGTPTEPAPSSPTD